MSRPVNDAVYRIETIRDMREFLAEFPPEADDYPFIVSEVGVDVASLVQAHTVTNCDGHPDYAGLVIAIGDEQAAELRGP